MKLRILHINPYYLPDVSFGGPAFSVSSLCEAMAQLGHEVSVFTVGYDKQLQYPFTKNINGVSVQYFKGNMGSPCQISFQLWAALRQQARHYDVIHLHTWWNILIFRAIKIIKEQGVPMVLSPRGMLGNYSFKHHKTGLKKLFHRLVGQSLLAQTQVLATSMHEVDEISRRGHLKPANIEMIPNLLGLKVTDLASAPATGFKLGFLSRLHHKKGIELLLNAIALCPQVDELIIGGTGDEAYEQQLRQQVNQLGIAGKVRFIGWVTQEKKADFFRQFHVFILPSFHENFANVVAEAWAAGKPAIISREVGLCHYLDQHHVGWSCAAATADIVKTIDLAFTQKNNWSFMGETARQMADTYLTNEKIASDYGRLYQRVVERKIDKGQKTNGKTLNKGEYILGINAYHADASAAIFHNGKLIAAIEEERFRRVKHWAGFPSRAIEFCLKEAGITLDQLNHIAFARDPQAKRVKKMLFMLRYPRALAFGLKGRLSNANAAQTVIDELKQLQPFGAEVDLSGKIHFIEHHRSHLASAFYASPFEEAALLSIDGSGDFSTTMMGIGTHTKIEVQQSVDFPHSLGVFYTAFTQLLGFPNYGDEYKVMGLAPYGKPVYADQLKKVIICLEDGSFRLDTKWFRSPGKSYVSYNEDHQPEVPILYSPLLASEFGGVRQKDEPLTQYHKDLAASVQHVTEQTIFHLLNHLHKRTGLDAVCIAGGVAQNSVANGKITSNTPFKKVYIPSAGHDAGLSMGAALYVQHQLNGLSRQPAIWSAYTGSRYTNQEIESLLRKENVQFSKAANLDELCNKVSDCIIGGGVVGWFRGRSEFGPRALGNRSILADPRRTDAKDLLNSKIKRRESFRPFAPSVLKEYCHEYFELTDHVPFMEKVFPIKENKRQELAAVTHVDGTGRLQTVCKQTNPDYYRLIDVFRQKTGVPVLLNTSFNENEPIVNSPTEALSCFLRTNMDMLVLEDYLITRH